MSGEFLCSLNGVAPHQRIHCQCKDKAKLKNGIRKKWICAALLPVDLIYWCFLLWRVRHGGNGLYAWQWHLFTWTHIATRLGYCTRAMIQYLFFDRIAIMQMFRETRWRCSYKIPRCTSFECHLCFHCAGQQSALEKLCGSIIALSWRFWWFSFGTHNQRFG